MLQATCRAGDELAATVIRVAQAALRVSDLWFTTLIIPYAARVRHACRPDRDFRLRTSGIS